MSGGGKAPAAPSLAGQVNNANTTFGQATSDAAQTLGTAQNYNTAAQNNLSGVVNTNNSMAGAIGNAAQQNLSTYGSTFTPLQATEAKAAQDYGSSDNIARLSGQAVGNVNAGVQASRANSAAALASEGVDPASIHGAALDAQSRVGGAAAAANAGTQAAIQGQQTAFGMENTANALGTQVGQLGTQGAATSANVADTGQNTVNATNSSGVNNLTAANQYLNTGVNANNSSVNANQAQFQDQLQSYNAQQQQSAGVGSLVGTLAGAATQAIPFMAEGGPVPSDYSTGGNVTARGALPASPIPGSTDTKPALLTPGEFVMPKDVVDFKGQDYFHRQIDSIREAKNKRMAIPTQHAPHQSMHS